MNMYDFIGDIHGHADKLKALLQKLGYELKSGVYRHDERKAFFIGDYIDRGTQSRETLHIVRSMVEGDSALALMGNHEFNALCFHFPKKSGGHLRPHSIKNVLQHYETLKSFDGYHTEYKSYLNWFATLPLFHEEDSFRAVHGAWHTESITHLKKHLNNRTLSERQLYEAADENTPLYLAVEHVLKGIEVHPGGVTFKDKDGNTREHARIKWWHEPHESTLINKGIFHHDVEDDLPHKMLDYHDWYHPDEKPVFFGHYWWKGNPDPYLLGDNICCLDFSIAENGHLMAYRFDGEKKLNPGKIVFI